MRKPLAERANGSARAEAARSAARGELEPYMHAQLEAVEAIRDTLPGAIIVGEFTQPVYAANLYYDHDLPGGWFSAATGFGALGYGPPAAIGAALARPGNPVLCLTGDGGFQFTLSELGTARDANTPVIFVVWNNMGYREIELSMRGASVEPVGVSPVPPDFCAVAAAYGLPSERVSSLGEAAGGVASGARHAAAIRHRVGCELTASSPASQAHPRRVVVLRAPMRGVSSPARWRRRQCRLTPAGRI